MVVLNGHFGASRNHFKLSAALCALLSLPVQAWGPQGHRVAGALTEPLLTEPTRSAISQLIGQETLADASTWADRMRASPSPFWQKRAGPYHYVTVPAGKRYPQVGAPARGDSVTALNDFRAVLEDPESSRAHKQLALRFSLHIIQDLHQPLHVGNGNDRGGNNVKVVLAGKTTNLHRVWDTSILAQAGRSDAAWVKQLSRISRQQQTAWNNPDPTVWIEESAAIRDKLYPTGNNIDADYLRLWLPSVEQRLQQSAVRTASWLNTVDIQLR